MRKISTIVIHHSQNRKTFQEIKDLHINEYKWDDIGYHFVINKEGNVINGRDLSKIGAHVYGYNKNSIGICLVGNFDEEKLNKKQFNSLINLINELKNEYNIKEIKGHHEFPNVTKTCPGKNINLDKIKNSIQSFK